MEAPDKIYAKYKETDIAYIFDIDKYPSKDAIEYIRKDAIMKKLKAQQDKCVFRSTYWDFWQAVINEVNKI